jgi:replicative DNA helicase
MSNVQLVNRFISSEVELPGEKLKNGSLADHEWAQLERKIRNLEEAPIFVDDTPALSVFEFRAKLRRLVMQHKVEVAIVDYLQLMTSPGAGSRVEEVSIISRSLKAIAKELSIPIIALSQLSRAVEQRAGDKRPQLSDLRESGAIEQDADIVMFIHRPEYYGLTQDEAGNSLIGMAEIIVAKHRSGSIGDVLLKFVKEFTRFMDPEEQFGLPSGEGGATFSSKMNEDDESKERAGLPAPDLSGFENAGLDVNNSFDEANSAPF